MKKATKKEKEVQETIMINDKLYVMDDLPEQVKQLIGVYRKWATDLSEARLEVAKHEAAMRDLASEISRTVAASEMDENETQSS